MNTSRASACLARPGTGAYNFLDGVARGMIQVVEHPDPTLTQEVRGFLAAAQAATGVCGEHDPGWLQVLREGLGHQPMMLIARDDGKGIPRGFADPPAPRLRRASSNPGLLSRCGSR